MREHDCWSGWRSLVIIVCIVGTTHAEFSCEDYSLPNDSAGRGVIFDIDTTSLFGLLDGTAITVDNFWIFPENDIVDEPVYIWVTKNKRTYEGIEENEDEWYLLASTHVSGTGGELVDLGLQLGHYIPADVEYGVYISFENAAIMTERGGGDTFSWTDFTLDAGFFMDGNFTGKRGSNNQEYGFSGIMCYELTGETPTPTLAPSPSPTSSPTAAPTPAPTAAPTPDPETVAPFVESVMFSPTGSAFSIHFSVPTNRNGAPLLRGSDTQTADVPCETMLDQETISSRLGTSPPPRCYWRSRTEFHVILGTHNATLVWMSEVGFAASPAPMNVTNWLVEGEGEALVFEPSGPAHVQYPDNPSLPIASLVAPTQASACHDFTLDARSSSNFVQSRTHSYRFSSFECAELLPAEVETAEPTLTISSDAIQRQLAQADLDWMYCTFAVEVENFLGVESAADVVTVQLFSDGALTAVLRGPSSGTWSRDKSLVLEADVEVQSCLDNDATADTSDTQLSIMWFVTDLATAEVMESLGEVTDVTNTTQLVVPAFSVLQAGGLYRFDARIEVLSSESQSPDADTSINPAIASSDVRIMPSAVRAVIDGPTGRTLSQSQQEAFEFDGSPSYDPDVAPDMRSTDDLEFSWECFNLEDLSECWLDSNVSVLTDVPLLTVPSSAFTSGSAYQIGLRVRRHGSLDSEWSDAEPVTLSVTSDAIPVVSISGTRFLDADAVLRLEGSVASSPGEHVFHWSVAPHAPMASEDIFWLSPSVLTSRENRNLVIDSGFLDTDVAYTFTLTALSRTSSLEGSASVQVTLNSGPRIAELSASPTNTSSAGSHLLEASAYAVVPDTEPFRYRFSYASDQGENSLRSYINDYSFSSFLEVDFLPGAYVLWVDVQDSIGRVSSRSTTFTVESSPSTSCSEALTPMLTELEAFGAELEQLETSSAETTLSHSVGDFMHLCGMLARSLSSPQFDSCRPSDLRLEALQLLNDLLSLDMYKQSHAVALAQNVLLLTTPASGSGVTTKQVDGTDDANGAAYLTADGAALALSLTSAALDFADEALSSADVPQVVSLTGLLGPSLSNVLASPHAAQYSCDLIHTVREQLERVFHLELEPLLAGEQAVVYSGSSVAGGAVRQDRTDDGINLTGGSSALRFNASITVVRPSDGETATTALVIVTLDSSVSSCFADGNGDGPEDGAPVVIITTPGTESRGAGFTAEFSLPFEPRGDDLNSCGEILSDLKCMFKNDTSNLWEDTGCEVVDTVILENGVGELRCRCTHLTTFTVIRTLRGISEDACATSPMVFGIVFVALFAAILLYTLPQTYSQALFYHQHQKKTGSKNPLHLKSSLRSMALVVFLCITNMLWLVLYTFFAHSAGAVFAVSVFVSLSRVTMFWIFAITLYQWLTIAFGSMEITQIRVKRARRIFYVVVSLASAIFIALAVALGVSPVESQTFELIDRAGTACLALLNVATIGGFVFFGTSIIWKIYSSAKVSGARGPNHKAVVFRIFKIVTALCLIFSAQTVLLVVLVVIPEFYDAEFITFMSCYLALDILSLAVVMLVFRSVTSGLRSKQLRNPGSYNDLTSNRRSYIKGATGGGSFTSLSSIGSGGSSGERVSGGGNVKSPFKRSFSVASLSSVQMSALQRSPAPSQRNGYIMERSNTEGSLSISALPSGYASGAHPFTTNGGGGSGAGIRKHSLPSLRHAHNRQDTMSRSSFYSHEQQPLSPLVTGRSSSPSVYAVQPPRGSFSMSQASQISTMSAMNGGSSGHGGSGHSMPRPVRPGPARPSSPMMYRTNSQASQRNSHPRAFSNPALPLPIPTRSSSPMQQPQQQPNAVHVPMPSSSHAAHAPAFIHTLSRVSVSSSMSMNSDFSSPRRTGTPSLTDRKRPQTLSRMPPRMPFVRRETAQPPPLVPQRPAAGAARTLPRPSKPAAVMASPASPPVARNATASRLSGFSESESSRSDGVTNAAVPCAT